MRRLVPKKNNLLCCLILMLAIVLSFSVASPVHAQVSLGKMTAFWRTCMMTGGKDQITPWHLYSNPVAYLDDSDFPYNYSKYGLARDDEFVLHGDVASYVRFLSMGSNNNYDLAIRVDGKVTLRKEEVRKRFEKTEASGAIKNYIIVLDNIPFCFPKAEDIKVETYGQTALPEDMDEWKTFIIDLCNEIKNVLGEERANKLFFRLGTEAHNGDRYHYSDPNVMLNFYKITAQAVKSVLPQAKFGPYNTHTPWKPETQILKFSDLVAFCIENELPLDFIGYSWYVQGSDPWRNADGFIDHWKEAVELNPELENVPKRYEEFGSLGVSGNNYMRPSSDNAAAMFNMLVDSKVGGFTGTFHWPVDVKIAESPATYVLNGLGWMFQVLDHTTGGESYLLSNSIIDDGVYGSDVRALGTFHCDNGKSYLIVSSFNADENKAAVENVKVEIPKNLVSLSTKLGEFKAATLDRDNCPLLAIRNDIEEAGRLSAIYKSKPNITTYFPVHYVLVTNSVTNVNLAKNVINRNLEKYVGLCKNSLTLKDKSVSVSETSTDYEFVIPIRANSISVIELNGKTTSSTDVPGKSSDILVYPNPASQTVSLAGLRGELVHYDIINSLGQLSRWGKPSGDIIDIRTLPPGYYFLRLADTAGNTFVSRFIKKSNN